MNVLAWNWKSQGPPPETCPVCGKDYTAHVPVWSQDGFLYTGLPSAAGTDIPGLDRTICAPAPILASDPFIDYQAQRAMIGRFLQEHLTEDVDYGRIRMGNRDSKPSLFKPGAEKLAVFLGVRPTFVQDRATWEMAGSRPGVLAYICYLERPRAADPDDIVVVGEGRGLYDPQENKPLNSGLKIAEKRAMVDAMLRLAALSEVFTQDLEDMGTASGESKASVTVPDASERQRQLLEEYTRRLVARGVNAERARDRLMARFGVTHERLLTVEQLDEVLADLRRPAPATPEAGV